MYRIEVNKGKVAAGENPSRIACYTELNQT